MADISLDEFIRKNNVKVRVSNPDRKPQQKGNFKQTPFAKNGKGQWKGQKFDARQKLAAKVAIKDARDKIIVNKKSGKGDARNRIVSKQVQKGTFDARSLIQRHKKTVGGPNRGNGFTTQTHGIPSADLALTRTLSNPNAKGKPQIQLTSSGLQVTRPVPNTQVSLNNNSIQVTKRTRPFGDEQSGRAQVRKDFVPIIQIRNDRYKQPGEPISHQYYEGEHERQPYYDSPQAYPTYSSSVPTLSAGRRAYRDLDNPEYNSASVAVPEIPRVHVSNVAPIEAAGMRPVSYSASVQKQHQLSRAPPGSATLSQGTRMARGSKAVFEPAAQPVQAGVKRRQPTIPAPPPALEMSGPLRLGKGGGPGIDLRPGDPQHFGSSIKKAKLAAPLEEGTITEEDDGADFISPLQGFRVVVTNLFTGVTQDDIIELFGAVGPLKKAKLLKSGSAEVVYVSKKDAISAVQKYHSRELDGQPMYVKMTTPVAATIKKAEGDHDPDITGEALRLYKKGTGIGSLPEAPIEIPTIHRALFKAGPPGPNKSVKFTVKI
ncbi:polymerase delta-interacting protein 3-like [Plakobranchus ocellatus]|uniref:Polymerase delta-interacting protein 3-like n=1 Tax=Plakobranchus ocellatus TaxID=259542 RepID=A0AAV4A7U4_9GAST|nr:polymerase delta-interacting protein 3-like [Plakobranchus ocellatus]